MKKLFLSSVAVAACLLMVSCDKEPALQVATFEDVTVGESGTNATFTTDGIHGWTSGEFAFTTGAAYDATYFYNFVVSSQSESTYESYADQYHSAAGGAAEGKQFAVAFQDDYSDGAALEIKLNEVTAVGSRLTIHDKLFTIPPDTTRQRSPTRSRGIRGKEITLYRPVVWQVQCTPMGIPIRWCRHLYRVGKDKAPTSIKILTITSLSDQCSQQGGCEQ